MPVVQGRPGGLLQFMRLVGKYAPVLLWAHFKSSLEVSEHSGESVIRSLTDSEQYLVRSKTTAPSTL